MRKRPTRPDDENPEWRSKMIREARPLKDALPGLYETLRRYQGQRGPQKAPTKQQISLRVDRDVAEALRASGPGWQTRANDALRAHAVKAGLVRERPAAYGPGRAKARKVSKVKSNRAK